MQEEEVKKEAVVEAEDDGNRTIILQVDMDCEGCKAKVKKAIQKLKGLQLVEVNMKEQKVTLKGKLDPKTTCETVNKKSGKRAVLIYPDPQKLEEDRKKAAEAAPKKEETPPPPIPEVVVVLKVHMHCGACARQIKKNILKMDGVKEVDEDLSSSLVTVKGKGIDPNKLCERVRKGSGKRCEIVPPPPEPSPEDKKVEKASEEKKEEEKEEEAPKASEEKKEEEKPAPEASPEPQKTETESTPEAADEDEETKEVKSDEVKSDEVKKEEPNVESKDGPTPPPSTHDSTLDMRKYEYTPYASVPNYVYPPQLFSDENPNACSVM